MVWPAIDLDFDVYIWCWQWWSTLTRISCLEVRTARTRRWTLTHSSSHSSPAAKRSTSEYYCYGNRIAKKGRLENSGSKLASQGDLYLVKNIPKSFRRWLAGVSLSIAGNTVYKLLSPGQSHDHNRIMRCIYGIFDIIALLVTANKPELYLWKLGWLESDVGIWHILDLMILQS